MKTRTTLAVSALALALAVPALTSTRAFAAPPLAAAAGFQDGPAWDAPPPEFREFQRQGFHDGVEGARKDFDNHRAPNVDNREEYRHPHVPHDMRMDYRDGFRRGYEMAMNHLKGEHHEDHPY